jgi:hypothetical protein
MAVMHKVADLSSLCLRTGRRPQISRRDRLGLPLKIPRASPSLLGQIRPQASNCNLGLGPDADETVSNASFSTGFSHVTFELSREVGILEAP